MEKDILEIMISEEQLKARIQELGEELKNAEIPVFLVGDGSILCYNTLKDSVPGLILPPEHKMHQRAAGVALAAQAMLDAGEICDPGTLTPNYLRLSQAERERLEKTENKLQGDK